MQKLDNNKQNRFKIFSKSIIFNLESIKLGGKTNYTKLLSAGCNSRVSEQNPIFFLQHLLLP